MARLEELTRGASVKGLLPAGVVTVVDVAWYGTEAVELTYKDAAGRLGHELLCRDDEMYTTTASGCVMNPFAI